MVKVKLCGLRRMEDVVAVNAVSPDVAGFVFAPGKRQVNLSAAALLCAAVAGGIEKVGVFVDAPLDEIIAAARRCGLHAVQLHGRETAETVAALRAALPVGCAVWKAARVRSADDIRAAEATGADLLLLDAYSPLAAGGTGERFDWHLLQNCRPALPFFLAGGLTPETVADAVRTVAPYGVDVSSGVETDGWKDPEKMERFTRAARRASSGGGQHYLAGTFDKK